MKKILISIGDRLLEPLDHEAAVLGISRNSRAWSIHGSTWTS